MPYHKNKFVATFKKKFVLLVKEFDCSVYMKFFGMNIIDISFKMQKKILTSGVSQNTNDLYFLYSFLLFEQTSVRHAFILIMEF